MNATDTLTRHAPRLPVDPTGLDAAHRATLARLDDTNLTLVPAPTRTARPALRWGLAAASAAALTVAGLTIPSPGDQPAFAGWRADPTSADPAALAANSDECARLGGDLPGVPDGPVRLVLSELRGPYTFTVLYTGDWLRYCLVGPTLRFANATDPDGTTGFVAGDGSQQGSGSVTADADGLRDPAPGELTLATAGTFADDAGDAWSTVLGRVAPDVTSVRVTLTDGTTVDATAADGVYAAWWPGSVAPAEVTGVRADGSTARAGSGVDWSHPAPSGSPQDSDEVGRQDGGSDSGTSELP
ncbi:hypothetical protein Cch01nite_28310 [Cellulomonas chitinilytica]|uniref:Uncharacterized protein n=1 Tax=Cellulomonas chitinilytica TaxID=398759 RepID=A0A919P2H9_9CELL|nr:hypothetical protein [Cellulomonas chitinilytica]GIG22107.1 hypothetical protein Cch01nite_28310 [Cellulomonas chitinilytica]